MRLKGLGATGRRAGLTAACAVLALGVGSAAAEAACDEPGLQVTSSKAKAGEQVPFSITGTTPGAEYLLRLGDKELNSGTAAGTSVSNSFKMPDLGNKNRGAQVQAVIAHDQCENSPWKLSEAITYQAPAQKTKSKPAQKNTSESFPGAKELANLKAQQKKERRAARKQQQALQKALKKRQATAKRRAKAQKQNAEETKRRQRRQRERRQKALEQALLKRQQQQKAKQGAKQPNASATTASTRQGGGSDSSNAFVALGVIYALIAALGAIGYLLWRRSGRGAAAPPSKGTTLPPIPELGDTPGGKAAAASVLAGEMLDDDEAPSTPAALEPATGQAAPASEKVNVEAELQRMLTDAGIDAELGGIVADAQAEAERRGVPFDADLMMQVLCNGQDGATKLAGPAEGQLRSKLQEIVAEEKERLALQDQMNTPLQATGEAIKNLQSR